MLWPANKSDHRLDAILQHSMSFSEGVVQQSQRCIPQASPRKQRVKELTQQDLPALLPLPLLLLAAPAEIHELCKLKLIKHIFVYVFSSNTILCISILQQQWGVRPAGRPVHCHIHHPSFALLHSSAALWRQRGYASHAHEQSTPATHLQLFVNILHTPVSDGCYEGCWVGF